MVDHARARKLAERIKVIVAEALERGVIKDSRLGFVTITDVRMTGDLQHATIFYTVLGTDVVDERNNERRAMRSAIDAGLLPGGKRPEKPKPVRLFGLSKRISS